MSDRQYEIIKAVTNKVNVEIGGKKKGREQFKGIKELARFLGK